MYKVKTMCQFSDTFFVGSSVPSLILAIKLTSFLLVGLDFKMKAGKLISSVVRGRGGGHMYKK